MHVTFNVKYNCGQRGFYREDNSYDGFGNVTRLNIYDEKRKACLFDTVPVVRAVSCDHPILVDPCKVSSCLVEMDLSSRYMVVGDEWRGTDFHRIIRRLQERRIYALTEVQRHDFNPVKSMIEKSYYTDDGELRDSTFKDNLSPANMAEAGIKFVRNGVVSCYYGYIGSHKHYMRVSSEWHGCQSTPTIRHQELFNSPPCIELKKYQFPVLSTESGEDVTGATYRMLIPGGVGGHPQVGCNAAVLVTNKNHELPVMDGETAQHEVLLVIIDTLKKKIRNRIEESNIGILDFAQQAQQVIYLEHFTPLFGKLQLATDRLIMLMNQFQLQVEDKDDKDEIRKKIDEIAEALKVDGIKKEMEEIIGAITNYEKANFVSTMINCPAYLKRKAEIDGMPDLNIVEQELVKLREVYSKHFFLDDFFNRAVNTEDFNDLFADFQHCFWNGSDDNRLIVDITVSRTELLKSINAVHEKVEELLTIYLEACKSEVPAVSDNPAQTLQSPLLGEIVPNRLNSASLVSGQTSISRGKTKNAFRLPNCCVTGWLTDANHVLHCHLPP
ncbi:hypothetical protein [Endozoicomonas sp. YOMI1]|uniref:hypothetical protein n=1 Tax=Endozoicomonas sp. YOMI1 TaxID=2828739 RepID=UPI002148FCEB|nr:hypothetical protein [Endozoicomonas sp. YOMI1]